MIIAPPKRLFKIKPKEDPQPVCKTLSNGTKEWWLNGKLHRTDGPAIEWNDGDKEWWLDGKRHRIDGPAIECSDGYKEWYLNGKLHRIGGAAIERNDGSKEWWIDDEEHTFEEYLQKLQELGYEEHVVNLLFQLDTV